jgi:hypothetical protein
MSDPLFVPWEQSVNFLIDPRRDQKVDDVVRKWSSSITVVSTRIWNENDRRDLSISNLISDMSNRPGILHNVQCRVATASNDKTPFKWMTPQIVRTNSPIFRFSVTEPSDPIQISLYFVSNPPLKNEPIQSFWSSPNASLQFPNLEITETDFDVFSRLYVVYCALGYLAKFRPDRHSKRSCNSNQMRLPKREPNDKQWKIKKSKKTANSSISRSPSVVFPLDVQRGTPFGILWWKANLSQMANRTGKSDSRAELGREHIPVLRGWLCCACCRFILGELAGAVLGNQKQLQVWNHCTCARNSCGVRGRNTDQSSKWIIALCEGWQSFCRNWEGDMSEIVAISMNIGSWRFPGVIGLKSKRFVNHWFGLLWLSVEDKWKPGSKMCSAVIWRDLTKFELQWSKAPEYEPWLVLSHLFRTALRFQKTSSCSVLWRPSQISLSIVRNNPSIISPDQKSRSSFPPCYKQH